MDPADTHGHKRGDAKAKTATDLARLESVQERIYAEHRHRILILLQGIDTAGKDGTISHVMTAFNPQGCRVVGFGVPSAAEHAHDYLWRHHRETPGDGEIVIHNRSHYESVLVERVKKLTPDAVWARRYDEINDFEAMLADADTTIIKLFLHISRDEQRDRLLARLHDPTKRWKFNMDDLGTRAQWDDYVAAFDDALSKCSTDAAPWYVIPADHKWFRNLAVGDIVAERLEALNPQYPPRDDLPADVTID